MKTREKRYFLAKILEMKPNRKIIIDEGIERDEDENYPVNVGYLRVSTDRQADLGFGLELQEADILRYCKANGYSNRVRYIDDGYTGTNMDRPALQEIIDAITAFNTGRSRIQAQIRSETERATIDKKIRKARSIFCTLRSTWEHMSEAERQSVCQELLDRVILYTVYNTITVKGNRN